MARGFIGFVVAIAVLWTSNAISRTALTEQQPAAKIVVDPPLAEPLSRGVVFIQYRTENLQIVPVFGPKALDVSPRIGHLRIAGCCARAASGHASAPPSSVMNLRRFIR